MTTKTARVTPGPWKAWRVTGASGSSALIDGADEETVAKTYTEPDLQLILAAVNACFAINPTNPMAAAEAMVEVFEMAQAARNCMKMELKHFNGSKAWQGPHDALDTAIAKATAKGGE